MKQQNRIFLAFGSQPVTHFSIYFSLFFEATRISQTLSGKLIFFFLSELIVLVIYGSYDMCHFTGCSYWKYVDDVTISEVAPARATTTLQSERDALNSWADKNNMKLNPKKCKELTVHFRRHIEHFPPVLAVNGNALGTVEACKVLGVTIQSNLNWGSHVNE